MDRRRSGKIESNGTADSPPQGPADADRQTTILWHAVVALIPTEKAEIPAPSDDPRRSPDEFDASTKYSPESRDVFVFRTLVVEGYTRWNRSNVSHAAQRLHRLHASGHTALPGL